MSSEEEMGGGAPENADDEPRRESAGSDLVVPVAGVAFTLYYFTTIINSPWTAQVSAFFIGAVLILLSTFLFIRVALRLRAGTAHLDFSRVIEPRGFMTKRLILLALTITYVYVIHWTGFTLTTFIFLSLAMLLLNDGRNKGLIFILSAIMSLSGWALFVYAFAVRFPAGPFEQLMKSIL
ncbi:MAG TPA: tripartite tricarboxylate transporter TctB family protein [Alphaproteobacteria bacterium]|nr:tripartite tricarboxylate transporter TctB family protein [Alphaproteobacteria bacterium]